MTRTRDILLRRQMLYPAELRGLGNVNSPLQPQIANPAEHKNLPTCQAPGFAVWWVGVPRVPGRLARAPVRDPGSCGPSGHGVMDITPAICHTDNLSMNT